MFLTYQFLSEKNTVLSNTCLLLITVTLFSILINDNSLIQKIGSDLIIASLLIILHSAFYHSFHKEFSEGIIEQVLLQPISLEIFLTKKIFYTSLLYQVSMLLAIPILTILTNINVTEAFSLTLVTLCVIPIIITLSLLGSALSLKRSHSNAIRSIIILPLLIPVAILGNSVAHGYQQLFSLSALIILTLPINIIAISYLLTTTTQDE